MADYACMGWTVHGPCLGAARFLVTFGRSRRTEGACGRHLVGVLDRRCLGVDEADTVEVRRA